MGKKMRDLRHPGNQRTRKGSGASQNLRTKENLRVRERRNLSLIVTPDSATNPTTMIKPTAVEERPRSKKTKCVFQSAAGLKSALVNSAHVNQLLAG